MPPGGVHGIGHIPKGGAIPAALTVPSASGAKLIGLLSLRILFPSTSTSVAFDLVGTFTACIARLESIRVASCWRSSVGPSDLPEALAPCEEASQSRTQAALSHPPSLSSSRTDTWWRDGVANHRRQRLCARRESPITGPKKTARALSHVGATSPPTQEHRTRSTGTLLHDGRCGDYEARALRLSRSTCKATTVRQA